MFNEKKEKLFLENFKKISEEYMNEFETKQKQISSIFIDEILFEIIKFLDVGTLILTVNFKIFFLI